MIAPDHRVEVTPSVVKPIEEKKVSNVVVEAEQPKVEQDKKREQQLAKEDIIVDLPGFGEYQDRLASYAYRTCKGKLRDIEGMYSCENLVLTWNAENGGRNKDIVGVTQDRGLCQLNPRYHNKFIQSERFNNPLSQLDYCLGVWINAKETSRMPRYAFEHRHKRNKGIVFKSLK